jgi:hypothetical protein
MRPRLEHALDRVFEILRPVPYRQQGSAGDQDEHDGADVYLSFSLRRTSAWPPARHNTSHAVLEQAAATTSLR